MPRQSLTIKARLKNEIIIEAQLTYDRINERLKYEIIIEARLKYDRV